jgi:RNA recognition motif-containing protein
VEVTTLDIYVGNLPYTANESEVEQLFAAHGEVIRCNLPIDRDSGRPRGFGFVEMGDSDARTAIAALDGTDFGGRDLRVNEARPRGEGGGGGGGGGGYDGGGGGGGGYRR